MGFIWIAVLSHAMFAVNSVIDKFLLEARRISHPAAYAFAIGLLSVGVVLLAPFGFSALPAGLIILALVAGALFTYALLGLFAALTRGDASRVVPVVGGLVAFFTLVFAYFLVGERLAAKDFGGFLLLVVGMFLMAERGQKAKGHFYTIALGSAILFGLSFALSKKLYGEVGFINGLIWSRFGMALGALFLLLPRGARSAIFENFKRREGRRQNAAWFFTGQAVGAVASVLQNYAIALGSVSIVNALQGTQFAFVLLFTSVLSLRFPRVLREEVSQQILTRKIIAIIVIVAGVAVLSI